MDKNRVQPVFAQNKSAGDIGGDWLGTLNAGGTMLRLVVHFIHTPSGLLSGTLDSLDQGANGIPLSQVTLKKTAVYIESAAIGGTFDGTLSANGREITGQWCQGGGSLPLTLKKTEHLPAPVLNRPQEPKPPFPYMTKDVTFSNAAAGVTLAGTLTLPPGSGPFPVVLLISGSGRNTRDEPIVGHKPFLVLADYLTRQGLAVLRYDKRGTGASIGDYTKATSADFAADAQAGFAFLQSLPQMNPQQIGLIGHSEGGLIAPLVAVRSRAVAFIVLLAGPGLPGKEILLRQSALISKASGVSEAEITRARTDQAQAYAIVIQEQDQIAARKKLRALAEKNMAALPTDERKAANVAVETEISTLLSPWMRYFLAYDPRPTLRQVQCPVLALNGARDLQVPPQEDLDAIAAALQAGGNAAVTVKQLPNLNHLFQTCKTGSPNEYAMIEETIAPLALTTIADWVRAQTAGKETTTAKSK